MKEKNLNLAWRERHEDFTLDAPVSQIILEELESNLDPYFKYLNTNMYSCKARPFTAGRDTILLYNMPKKIEILYIYIIYAHTCIYVYMILLK